MASQYRSMDMAQDTLSCAVVQLQSGPDVTANLAAVRHWVAAAAERGARLVVLPENFAFFGPEARRAEIAERLEDGVAPICSALRETCARHNLYLVAGGMPEQSGDPLRPYNTAAVFDPSGTLVGRYRKAHLFDVTLPNGRELCESRTTTPGQRAIVVDVDGFRVGLSVCYDLRFPLLYAELRRQGAEIITVPAAFTVQTGQDHWHVLSRARAIETQCWLLAAAQWGVHPGERMSYGHSLVCDPWGNIVAQCSNQPAVALATIDRKLLTSIRGRFPCFEHRLTAFEE